MKQIVIYGKCGIDKSTTTQNLTAALSTMNKKIMQIGCDPKADSVKFLMNGKKQPSVLDTFRKRDHEKELASAFIREVDVNVNSPVWKLPLQRQSPLKATAKDLAEIRPQEARADV